METNSVTSQQILNGPYHYPAGLLDIKICKCGANPIRVKGSPRVPAAQPVPPGGLSPPRGHARPSHRCALSSVLLPPRYQCHTLWVPQISTPKYELTIPYHPKPPPVVLSWSMTRQPVSQVPKCNLWNDVSLSPPAHC